MKQVFLDSAYVIALVNRNDSFHQKAVELAGTYSGASLITTDAILLEIGSALSRGYRAQPVEIIKKFQSSSQVTIVHLNPSLLTEGFELYESHADKSWSLADCISFVTMKRFDVGEALTSDKHFEQAGFSTLMKM